MTSAPSHVQRYLFRSHQKTAQHLFTSREMFQWPSPGTEHQLVQGGTQRNVASNSQEQEIEVVVGANPNIHRGLRGQSAESQHGHRDCQNGCLSGLHGWRRLAVARRGHPRACLLNVELYPANAMKMTIFKSFSCWWFPALVEQFTEF